MRYPVDDGAVDAALAVMTVHHWSDQERGLRELRRVARRRVVVLTVDRDALGNFWLLQDYLPEALAIERGRFPAIERLVDALGSATVTPVPVAANCADGFVEAYFGRPEAFLSRAVRAAQSTWPDLSDGVEERVVHALAADLRSGAWDARHRRLRSAPEYQGALRLIVAEL